MRVTYVNTLYPPDLRGGAERVVQAQAEAMASAGHEVSVLAIGAQRHPQCIEQHIAGVRVLRAGFANRYFHGPGPAPPRLERLRWHLRDRYNERMGAVAQAALTRLAPDVVCFHNLAGWSVAAWKAAAALELPMVQVLHDQYLLCPTAMMFRAGSPCAHRCLICRTLRLPHARASRQLHAVVGVSRFVLEKLLAAGLFATVPLREVLPNSSAGPLPPARATRAAIDAGAPLRLGFIGTLAPCKGIEPLLQAMARLPARCGELRVAGRGEPRYEQALAQRYGHDGGVPVRFLGQADAAAFFADIDVCVVPSLWQDSLPSVVFESLGAGVPVIGARRGGIPEMVQDGFNGLLFDPDDPEALLRCLRRCIEQPRLCAALADNCRVSAARFYDMPRWITRHEAILAAAIAAARRPRVGQRAHGAAPEREALTCGG